MINGSGKQILNRILARLSTRMTPESELESATDAIRAGLLFHGSSADETAEVVSRFAWKSSIDERDGSVWRQGIAFSKNGKELFLSDIVNRLYNSSETKAAFLREFKELESEDFFDIIHVVFLLVSAQQMIEVYLRVETDEAIVDSSLEDAIKVTAPRRMPLSEDEKN